MSVFTTHSIDNQCTVYNAFLYLRHLLVRKDMDVNEHENLSNITLRHKFK